MRTGSIAILLGALVAGAMGAGCGGGSEDGGPDGAADDDRVDAGAPPDAAGDPDAVPSCQTEDLARAPRAATAGSRTVAPIDISSVEAVVELDAAAGSGHVVATVSFVMGDVGGGPAFDLRQWFDQIDLDGELHDFSLDWVRDLGGGSGSEMVVLPVDLAPCSEHTLVVEYDLHRPAAGGARTIDWGDATVVWDFWFSDLRPGRYLEQWLPANLIYDRFALTLELAIVGAGEPHVVVANGEVTSPAAGQWLVEYPDHFTSLSPLLMIWPASRLETGTRAIEPGAGGDPLQVDIFRDLAAAPGTTMTEILDRAEENLIELAAGHGPYPHRSRFTLFIWASTTRAMEYDGAATTNLSLLRHEVGHSWYGRGLKPALGRDGWIDEAWVTYVVSPPDEQLSLDDSPVELAPASGWARSTPSDSYGHGSRIFDYLARQWGEESVWERMRELLADRALGFVSTEDLERALYCAAEDELVLQLFHRFVRGHDDSAPAPPDGYCE